MKAGEKYKSISTGNIVSIVSVGRKNIFYRHENDAESMMSIAGFRESFIQFGHDIDFEMYDNDYLRKQIQKHKNLICEKISELVSYEMEIESLKEQIEKMKNAHNCGSWHMIKRDKTEEVCYSIKCPCDKWGEIKSDVSLRVNTLEMDN